MKDEVLRRMDQRRPLRSADSSSTVFLALQNVDKVDGFDASDIPRPGVLLALDSNGKFPASVFPSAQGEGAEGMGGLTIFGTGLTYLMEDIDGTENKIKVYHRVFTSGQYVWLKPSFAEDRKGKITSDGQKIEGGWEYTIDWSVDPRGATSFERGQSVIGIGAVGEGYITADARAQYSDRPFMDFIERTSDAAWGHRTRTRIGNLDGLTRNGIDTLTNPSGWGIWTENLYGRGEFYSGYPGGPEVRIRRRTLGNGQSVHGMEWLYTPSARWWVQWYNESNQRVFWCVRKPSAPGSPEKDLIKLQYRQGDPGIGEPDQWDYFLNIAATTILGELIADRVKVRGYLSAMVADFGILSTAFLNVASSYYNEGAKSGFYAWHTSDDSPWKSLLGLTENLGFEFWHNNERQGRWNYNIGALTFGPNDDVQFSALGLRLLAAAGVVGEEEKSIRWLTDDGVPVTRIMSAYGPGEKYTFFGAERASSETLREHIVLGVYRDDETIESVLNIIYENSGPVVIMHGLNRLRLDQLVYEASGANRGWTSSGIFRFDNQLLIPQAGDFTVQSALANRQVSVGRFHDTANDAYYHVIGYGTLQNDLETPQVNLIGIDYSTGNGRLVFRDQAGIWRTYNGTEI